VTLTKHQTSPASRALAFSSQNRSLPIIRLGRSLPIIRLGWSLPIIRLGWSLPIHPPWPVARIPAGRTIDPAGSEFCVAIGLHFDVACFGVIRGRGDALLV
jgi:hypothetical protein